MNYKIIIAISGFGILFLMGILLIIGTLLKWKPLIDPKVRQWLFSTQYVDKKYFGTTVVIFHNFLMGLILISVSLMGFLIALNK